MIGPGFARIKVKQQVSSEQAGLRCYDLRGRHLKWQEYGELASLPHNTGHFDAPMMFFHDAAGQRKAQTCAIALGGVERPENVRQVLRRNAAA
jgi:hypothetical protein